MSNDTTIEHTSVETGAASSQQPWLTWRVIWAGLIIAALPMLIPYFFGLWQLEQYQYVPALLVAVPWMAYSRSDRVIRPPRNWFAWGLVALGLVSIVLSIILFSPWFSAAGVALIGTALLYSLRGPLDSSLVILAAPLAMLVRLPGDFDQLLVVRLQGLTTRFTSLLLDLISIPHSVAGNVIELISRELFVAEACSGIQSVFTIAFLSTLIVAYRRHPIWFTPFYLAAAVVIAVLANSVRIAIVALGDAKFAADWTTGWSHDAIGYVTLTMAALFLLSFDQLVMSILHPIRSHDDQRWPNPLPRLWNRLVTSEMVLPLSAAAGTAGAAVGLGTAAVQAGEPVAPHVPAAVAVLPTSQSPAPSRLAFVTLSAAACVILAWSVFQVARRWQPPPLIRVPTTAYFVPSEKIFGSEIATVRVVNYEVARDSDNPRLGKAADIWTVQHGELVGQIVLSQPYFGWHELCLCYENMEWQLLDRSILGSESQAAEVDGNVAEYAIARFRKKDNQHGYLIFSAIDYQGNIAAPPPGLGDLSRITQRLVQPDTATDEELMMLQLWSETPQELTSDQLRVLKDAFLTARTALRAEIRQSEAN